MLASELPFEILRNIGRFLYLPDQLESCLVCRTWKIPFQDSMWDVIDLQNDEMMDKMSDVSTRVHAFYRKNGYRVRELLIWPNIYIDDQEIFTLQQHFPNLNCLIISHSCLGGPNFGSIADWNLWGSLTELNVDITGWRHDNPADAFLNISLGLPNLERLMLNRFNGNQPVVVTLDQLESFHSNLPQLKYLVLDMRPAAFENEEDALERIVNVKPATKLKHLQLNVFNSLYQWLCYFAIKYPNLQVMVTLQLLDNGEFEQYPKEKAFISSLSPPAFQYLEWIDVITKKNPKQLHLDIWKQFYFLNIKLKRITWAVWCDMTDIGYLEAIVKECMNLFSKTIETFHFLCDFDYRKSWDFTTHLEYFPALVDLYIKAPHSFIELDVLLDRCVSLKVLKVVDSKFFLSTNEYETPKNHGLRMLIGLDSITTCNTLEYLSARCRRLNYMCLVRSIISGEHSSNNSRISIDMSYTHFKKLQLNDSRFTLPSEGKDGNKDRNANYVVLSQPSSSYQITDSNHDHSAWDIYSDITMEDTWYFVTYKMFTSEGWSSTPWIMSKKDITTVVELLRRQDSGNINTINGKNEYLDFKMVPEEWCTENTPLAYVVLKCGSISNYDMSPGYEFNHYTWEMIYDTF
ncbi:hypothetical protein F4703DRAFT_1881629, partial [Phycomyces blakesleeanus]